MFLQLLYCDKQTGVSVRATGWSAFLGSLQISVAYIAYEKDADENIFYQSLNFQQKICSFLRSFTEQLYAAHDATSYNINNLFVSLKCQNDTFYPSLQIQMALLQYKGICMDAEVASFPEK